MEQINKNVWKLNLPIRVPVSKKSYFLINLNVYRNAHYQILNKAKQTFKEMVMNEIKQLPFFNTISLTYVLYPQTHRKQDVANVCSVVDKFFCDALTEAGKLTDDNYDYLKNIHYCFGSVDPSNPRVEVYIQNIINISNNFFKENNMNIQVQLTEDEVQKILLQNISKTYPWTDHLHLGPVSRTDMGYSFAFGSERVDRAISDKEQVIEEKPVRTRKKKEEKTLNEVEQEMIRTEPMDTEVQKKEPVHEVQENQQEEQPKEVSKTLFGKAVAEDEKKYQEQPTTDEMEEQEQPTKSLFNSLHRIKN